MNSRSVHTLVNPGVPTGFFSVYLAQAASQRVQSGVHDRYRGRVIALYLLVFGSTSLAGWWAENLSVGAVRG